MAFNFDFDIKNMINLILISRYFSLRSFSLTF